MERSTEKSKKCVIFWLRIFSSALCTEVILYCCGNFTFKAYDKKMIFFWTKKNIYIIFWTYHIEQKKESEIGPRSLTAFLIMHLQRHGQSRFDLTCSFAFQHFLLRQPTGPRRTIPFFESEHICKKNICLKKSWRYLSSWVVLTQGSAWYLMGVRNQ